MDTKDRYVLAVISKRKSELRYGVYGYSPALLTMFAMENLKASERALVINLSDGSIVYQFEGNKEHFPKRIDGDPNMVVEDSVLQELIREDPCLEDETDWEE